MPPEPPRACSGECQVGECAYVHWSVENAASIDVYVDGSIYVQSYDGTGYAPVCDELNYAGAHSFRLVAHSVTDDATATATYNAMERPEPEPEPEYEPEYEPSHSEVPAEPEFYPEENNQWEEYTEG